MSAYFNTLNARFQSDHELVKTCRIMYEGITEDASAVKRLPCVVLIVGDRVPRDSFASDIEETTLALHVWSKDLSIAPIDTMLDHLVRVFDDTILESAVMSIHGFRRIRRTGIELVDGRYHAVIEYTAVTTFTNRSPVVRAG